MRVDGDFRANCRGVGEITAADAEIQAIEAGGNIQRGTAFAWREGHLQVDRLAHALEVKRAFGNHLAAFLAEAGGDEVASQLVVDTLSDLLGPDRRISIRGKMLRVSDDTAVEVEGEIAGTVRDVVSLRPGGDTEEPMLYLTPIGYDTQPVYVPLKDIEEFYF